MHLAALRESLRKMDPGALLPRECTLTVGVSALLDAYVEQQRLLLESQGRLEAAEAEIRRLKGLPEPPDRGQGGSPGSHAQTAGASARKRPNLSTERERRRRKPGPGRGKGPRRAGPLPTESITLRMDRSLLPADAVPKGYRKVVKQEVWIDRRVVEWRLARYYSRSTGKTYQASVPTGWEGQFGPVIKALTLTLAHQHNMSHRAIHGLLTQFGVQISVGKVCDLITGTAEGFVAERREVLATGLASSPWQQTDMTPTSVDGKAETCQVIGNPSYTHFHTSAGHDRASVVRLLRAETPDLYLLDTETVAYLAERGWSQRKLRPLRERVEPYLRSRRVMERKLRGLLWGWSKRDQDEFWSAALLAGYRADDRLPRVTCLLTDDASIYGGVAPQAALCWIHELRNCFQTLRL